VVEERGAGGGCAPFSIIHSVTSWPSQMVEMTGTLKILFGLVWKTFQ